MKSQNVFRGLWVSWLRPILAVAVIVLPFKSSIAEINFVPTGSMKPTIAPQGSHRPRVGPGNPPGPHGQGVRGPSRCLQRANVGGQGIEGRTAAT